MLTNARAVEPAAVGSQADSLPFTRRGLAILALGLALAASGIALRFAVAPRGVIA